MRRHRWRPGNDAVSPVVGAVLLVGIAVMLMAALGVFVMGFGPGGQIPHSEVQFSQASSNVTITVVDGGGLLAEDVSVIVGSEDACYVGSGWSGQLEAGDEAKIDGYGNCASPTSFAPGDHIRVVWEPDNSARSDVIDDYEYL